MGRALGKAPQTTVNPEDDPQLRAAAVLNAAVAVRLAREAVAREELAREALSPKTARELALELDLASCKARLAEVQEENRLAVWKNHLDKFRS